MSNTKFTPGPWRWWDKDTGRPDGYDLCRLIGLGENVFGGYGGAGFLALGRKERNIADAHLIAAAPDLYARVEELTDALSIWEGEGTLPKEWEKLLSDAVDTLREARGEK